MTELLQDRSAIAHALAPQVDQALASGSTRHRFPQPLEAAYQAYGAELTSRQRLKMCIISLVVFNMGIAMDYTARPDQVWTFLLLRTVVASLPCLCLVWLSCRLKAYALRDWVAGAALIWIGLCVNVLITMRGVPPAHLAFSIGLLIIVTNIVFQLRTRVAACISVVIMVITAGFLWTRPGQLSPQDTIALVFVAFAGGLTLLANHRLESTLRNLYLMIMRETLRTGDMARVNEELTAISQTDALTGIANRRLFDGQFGTACASSRDTGEMLALLLIDVDHFKRYNDTHGHVAGDACLKQVAKKIALQVRRERDLPARIGGEEFAVLLRDATETAAQKVADRIHRALAADWPEGLAPVTVSIGLAIMRSPAAHVIMEVADKALYAAKNGGRNRTITTSAAAA